MPEGTKELFEIFSKFMEWSKKNDIKIPNESQKEFEEETIDDVKPVHKNYVGAKIRDNIHLIEGLCVGIIYHLHDCQWGILQPIGLLEGKPQRQIYLDTQRLDIIEDTGRPPKQMKVKLGDIVKDSISGFEGVVTTWTDELYGSPSVGVTATGLSKDGKVISEGFPEERVILIKSAEPEVSENNTAPRGASEVARFSPDND